MKNLLQWANFVDRIRYLRSFNICENTNIEAVFDLILETAVKNQLPQSELPSKLYIISDMEFDACAKNAEFPASVRLHIYRFNV